MSPSGIATEARQPIDMAEAEQLQSNETVERRRHLSVVAAVLVVSSEYQDPFNELSGDEQIPFGD